MKKKLSLNDLKVKSFITEPEGEKVKGGQTQLSCYKNISCFEIQCSLLTIHDYCITNATK